jgi:hypothetical protein
MWEQPRIKRHNMSVSISMKSHARGTKNRPVARTPRAGAMKHRVVSAFIQGENTMACATNMTKLHSVNIIAI